MNSLSLPTFSPWKKNSNKVIEAPKKKLKWWFFFVTKSWEPNMTGQNYQTAPTDPQSKEKTQEDRTWWKNEMGIEEFETWVLKVDRKRWLMPIWFLFPRYQNQTCKGEREELFLLQVIKWERLIKETHWLDRFDSQLWFIAHW